MTRTSSKPVPKPVPFVILLVLGLIAGTGVIALNLVGNYKTSPVGLWIGLAFSAAYVAVLLLIFAIMGILPPKPWVWLPIALWWGAGAGMGFVMIAGDGVTNLFEQLGLPIFTVSLSGAWPEEIGKGLGTLLILLCIPALKRPWHGLAVGAFVGLGFVVIENIGYGVSGGMLNPVSNVAGVSQIWLTRTIAGPMQHAIFTGIAGWGIGLGLFSRGKSTAWRWTVALGFVLLGFFCHFLWNASPSDPKVNYMTMGVAALVGYGTFIFLLFRARKLEKKSLHSGS
ncbi:PrsW family intramembrane metalloprotease [Corynebacterium falsenii]|uniref:PrsW family intramembrane metalloprotease n=1 Tax=Corynebacterium falsenii TaxID=108486 RepID=UPI001CCA1528|nr:PrsW family intramembrane metalloprotease [Corynebacterium falsenii]UBI06570.1 PrsW family intramembrane metalloprotease [Corynebacterium falsenii]